MWQMNAASRRLLSDLDLALIPLGVPEPQGLSAQSASKPSGLSLNVSWGRQLEDRQGV